MMITLRNYLCRKRILSLFLLCFAVSIAYAQQRTITGKVTSEAEGALPGVNIIMQGTVTGVMSDVNGNYSIEVPGPETVLVFSFIGYTVQSVTVGSQSTIDVTLVPATSELGEVVVIGYGTQRKRRGYQFYNKC